MSLTYINPANPWQPMTAYVPGDSVTPQPFEQAQFGPRPNPADDTINLPVYQFVCAVGGTSGQAPPAWPAQSATQAAGQLVRESDGGPLWMCLGIALN